MVFVQRLTAKEATTFVANKKIKKRGGRKVQTDFGPEVKREVV
jgi:hypothetical protein